MRSGHHTLRLNQMWNHRRMRIALLGIILIPLAYSFIYLWAFFDPDDSINNLPVAVVNEDQGTIVDGEKIDAGDELVKKLKKEPKMKWEFIDRKQMIEGFQTNRYYLAVVIPKDFSKQAASVEGEKPLQASIHYYANEGYNFLSSKIGKNMALELENEVKQNITRMVADGMFKRMEQSADNLAKAVDGAEQLSGATGSAVKATEEIKSGTEELQDGVHKFVAGEKELNQGLVELDEGLQRAHDGTGKLAEGAESLRVGLQSLSAGSEQGSQGATQLQKGARDVASGLGSLQSKLGQDLLPGTDKLTDGSKAMASGNKEAAKQFAELMNKYPELQADPDAQRLGGALQSLATEGEKLTGGLVQLNQGITEVDGAVKQLHSGQQEVAKGAEKLAEGSEKQEEGAKQLLSGATTLSQQLSILNQGQAELAAGSKQLIDGSDRLQAGGDQLSDGMERLDQGVGKLKGGLVKIHEGEKELASELDRGVKDTKEALSDREQKAKVIADPVRVKENRQDPVPNYATGFTPYFLSLSLWVGAMILFTVTDLYRAELNNFNPVSPGGGAVVGILQALIVSSALLVGLGIDAQLSGWFYLLAIGIALTFVAINQMLVVFFKDVGRFIAILLLMLQLTSSGGTYPIELTPHFFQEIHPYLPMTYAIQGLRAAISTGEVSVILDSLRTLSFYFLGAHGLMWIVRWVKRRFFSPIGLKAAKKGI